MGHYDKQWRELIQLEERLEELTKSMHLPTTKAGKKLKMERITEIKKRIKEINEELDDAGDFKFN